MASRTFWRSSRPATFVAANACSTLGAAAAAVALVAAASAAAPVQPRWLPPRDLSSQGADAVIPAVVVDPKGNALVAWAQALGSSWTVDVVERPPGGPWSAPYALSDPADHVGSPQLAAAGDSVVAVWEQYDGKNLIVQAAVRNAKTRTWTAPTALSAAGRDAQTPQVAVDARGDAVAVWASVMESGWTVDAAYRPAGGSWQKAVPIQAPQQATAAPDVVIDAAGRAVAAWASTAGRGWRVRTATRGSDGRWTAPTTLSGSDPTGSVAPQLALQGTNDVLAVWSRSVGGTNIIESVTRSAAKAKWGAVSRPFGVADDALAPSIAVDARGDAVIVWTNSAPEGLSVMASSRRAGAAWDLPTVLSGATLGALSPQVAVDARGNALAVWTQSTGGASRVRAATLTAGGWSAARYLSKAGADALAPHVALDASGDGAVAWSRYDGQSFVIQGEGYDGSGPALSRLVIPSTGIVGQRLRFTVAPKDVWTSVGTIRWSFGDGTAGTGRATTHVYARPGRYVVAVTVADAFGHVTSARRVVTISTG